MGGRKSRYTKEVLDWYCEEDAGDLRRNEVNELVEKRTALNALEEKSWTSEKSNQDIVTNEEFVKNSEINARFDPKVVMDLYILKNWWRENFRVQQPNILGRICR